LKRGSCFRPFCSEANWLVPCIDCSLDDLDSVDILEEDGLRAFDLSMADYSLSKALTNRRDADIIAEYSAKAKRG